MYWIIPIVIYSIVCSVITSAVAESRGRDSTGWSYIGFLLGVFGLILVLALPKDTVMMEKISISSGCMRKCPHCAELVKPEATICRYCNRELPPITYPKL